MTHVCGRMDISVIILFVINLSQYSKTANYAEVVELRYVLKGKIAPY